MENKTYDHLQTDTEQSACPQVFPDIKYILEIPDVHHFPPCFRPHYRPEHEIGLMVNECYVVHGD